MLLTRLAIISACVLLASTRAFAQEAPPAGTITPLRGDLYRVNAGDQVTLFLVTPGGIILADPLDRYTAAWLQTELADRFPELPVRYVIHTSHRFERAEGASPFTETAEVIGHSEFDGALADARDHIEPPLSDLDRDKNGVFDAGELQADPRAAAIKDHDRNEDGRVSPGELYANVQSVETKYDERRTLTLGDRRVELVYPGPAYARDATAVFFPAERLVFVDRFPDIRNLIPESSRPREIARWARTIAALDADVVMNGRGEAMPHADVVMISSYLSDLFLAALAGAETGRSLADVQRSPLVDHYKGTAVAAQQARDVAATYHALRIYRMTVQAAGAVTAYGSDATYCATYTDCQQPRSTYGGLIGASISRRGLVGTAEITLAEQQLVSRTSPAYDEAFAHRETIVSVLGGYLTPPRHVSFAILGGVSYIVSDATGLSRTKPGFSGIGDRRFIGRNATATVFTAGFDLITSMGQRAAIVMPVRVIVTPRVEGDIFWPPGPVWVQAGIGLRLRLFRHAD